MINACIHIQFILKNNQKEKYIMKVLLLNGSPKPNGCTARALREMEKVFNDEGVETEFTPAVVFATTQDA